MKKAIALILTLTLVLCTAGSALAYEKYDAAILKELNFSQSQLTSSGNRSSSLALILVDYMLSSGNTDILNELAASGNCKIAAYGSVSVDAYYPVSGGKYRNLFLSGNTITDYELTNGPVSTKYTYYSVSISDLWDSLVEIANIMSSASGNSD